MIDAARDARAGRYRRPVPQVPPVREGRREELLAWLHAHIQWPLTVELHAAGGSRLARLTGRLRQSGRGPTGEYELDQDADASQPSAAFTVPELVAGVEFCGAVRARFEYVDVAVAVTIVVADT